MEWPSTVSVMFSDLVFTDFVNYLDSLPGCVREVDNGHCMDTIPPIQEPGVNTPHYQMEPLHTPLQDKNQAKETIKGGPCKWRGINGTDHPLNHQVLSINLGSARMLSIHTRLMA